MQLTIQAEHLNLTIHTGHTAANDALQPIHAIASLTPEGTTTPALGEYWPGQGGHYVATMPARDGKPAYHLIAADASADKELSWGPTDHSVDGSVDHFDGKANTKACWAATPASDGNQFPAIAYCVDYRRDGHHDFYLPSHFELMQACINAGELFTQEGYYWSSTQYGRYLAWIVDFEDGTSYYLNKIDDFKVRPFRRLEI